MTGILALAVAFIFSQFYRAFLAVMTPFLLTELDITKADLSVASGAWFISFALFQFPVGIWLDRYGPRWTCSVLFSIAAAGAFLFALASSAWMLILAMVLMGVGCSAVLMGAIFLIARNYPPARLALYSSWVVAFGHLGNVLSTSPLAAVSEVVGWRSVMVVLGVISLATAVAIAALVRNPARHGHAATGLSGYIDLLRIPALWPMLPLMFIGYTAVSGIRGLWIGPYISDTFRLDTVALGNVSLALALAMVVGTFLYGSIGSMFWSRKWVVLIGQSISICGLTLLAINVDSSLWLSTALLMWIGITGVGFGLLLAHGREFLPPHLVGRGVTFMNFCSIGGGGVMQLVTGALVTASARPDDPAHAYSVLFAFYAIIGFAALSVYLFSKPVGESAR